MKHSHRHPATATAVAAFGLILGLTWISACGGSPDDRTFLSIGTGGTGGIYYPLGGALAGRLSERDPDRRVTAEVSGGSVENVNRVAAGEIDLGFSIGTTVRQAYAGEGDYDRPRERLRIVAPLYPNLTHVVALADSPVRSIPDLAGRRVSVGSAGSGTEQLARHLLAGHGLDYDGVDEVFLTFTESSAALRDGSIVAAILSVGYPASAVLEVASSRDIRLLAVEPEPLRSIRAAHPFYASGTIPPGAYPGVEEPVPTLSVMNWIVGRNDLPDDVVRRVLDILAEDRRELVQVNEIARQIDLAAARDAPIPLHPATLAWLDEAGVT